MDQMDQVEILEQALSTAITCRQELKQLDQTTMMTIEQSQMKRLIQHIQTDVDRYFNALLPYKQVKQLAGGPTEKEIETVKSMLKTACHYRQALQQIDQTKMSIVE